MRPSYGVAALVVAFAASSADAQSNDPFFRSAQWRESVVGADGAGLGGAFVAVPDRAGTVALNPAALASLTRIELFASALRTGSGTGILNDALEAQTTIGLIGGGGMVTNNVAVGGFISQPSRGETTLSGQTVFGSTNDGGFLRQTVTDVGAAAAWKVSRRLHLGVQLVGTHLFLEGETRRMVGSLELLRAGSSSGHTLLSLGVGGLYTFNEKLTLGLAGFAGASWNATHTAIDPTSGRVFDEGSTFEVRRPSTLSSGVSYRVSHQILLAGQLDYVRYGEIQSALTIRQGAVRAADYQLENALEPRMGIEFAFAASNRVSVVLRGGVRRLAGGALHYTGPDSLEAAAFAGANSETRVSGGASLVLRLFRVDLAAENGDTSKLWMGLGTRF